MKTILLCIGFSIFVFFSSCSKTEDVKAQASDKTNTPISATVSEPSLDSGLICYLPFKKNLKDFSGHSNSGTLHGTISYVADRFGTAQRAVSFAASNAFIEIPEKDVIGLTEATVSIDFYPTSTNLQLLLSKMSYATGTDLPGFYQSLELLQNGGVTFGVRKEGFCDATAGTEWCPFLNSNTSVILNQWNHVAATFTNKIEHLYLNGNLVAASSKTPSPICQGEPIRLGVWWQSDPLYFTGYMDEVRIYNRALTLKEIKQLSSL